MDCACRGIVHRIAASTYIDPAAQVIATAGVVEGRLESGSSVSVRSQVQKLKESQP